MRRPHHRGRRKPLPEAGTAAYRRGMNDETRDSELIRNLEPGAGDVGPVVEGSRPGTSRPTMLFVVGAILAALGLIGVAVYAFMPRNTPAEGDAQADAALQAGLVIGSAVALGVGALLLVWGVVMRRRTQRRD